LIKFKILIAQKLKKKKVFQVIISDNNHVQVDYKTNSVRK